MIGISNEGTESLCNESNIVSNLDSKKSVKLVNSNSRAQRNW